MMWKSILRTAAVALLFVATLGACGFTNYKDPTASGDGGTGTPPVQNPTNPSGTGTFTEVSAIVRSKCLSCHSSGSPNFSSYSSMMGMSSLVVAGNPEQSLLYTITQSGSMPPGGSDLTSAQLQTVYSWIEAGAKND